MIRQRPLRLARTCDDTTCGVCASRWWDGVAVAIGSNGWRCREWPGRTLLVSAFPHGTERLPECLAAEGDGGGR
jgi:hypothetical protein